MTDRVRHVVLLGLMGAGKTSVGRELAHRLGWVFSDSDEVIQSVTGKSVRELAAGAGIDGMHSHESQHVLTALRRDQPSVICAAASVVEDARCREALAGPAVFAVWLRAEPATLASRFASSLHRPAFGGDPMTFLAQQSAVRSALFEEVSRVTIDVDHLSAEAAADAIYGLVGFTTPG